MDLSRALAQKQCRVGVIKNILTFYRMLECLRDRNMYFVYIIRCKDKSLYTGITTDLARRFKEHKQKKGGAYTSSHPVEKIVYSEKCKTRGGALKREAEIKNLKRGQKLKLIKKWV